MPSSADLMWMVKGCFVVGWSDPSCLCIKDGRQCICYVVGGHFVRCG